MCKENIVHILKQMSSWILMLFNDPFPCQYCCHYNPQKLRSENCFFFLRKLVLLGMGPVFVKLRNSQLPLCYTLVCNFLHPFYVFSGFLPLCAFSLICCDNQEVKFYCKKVTQQRHFDALTHSRRKIPEVSQPFCS